jgi:hypothetical protein
MKLISGSELRSFYKPFNNLVSGIYCVIDNGLKLDKVSNLQT